jgi:hypothetical protein
MKNLENLVIFLAFEDCAIAYFDSAQHKSPAPSVIDLRYPKLMLYGVILVIAGA